jgi:hypothetical protein
VVLAEARRGAYSENLFNSRSGFELSANNLGLAVDAAEGQDYEHRDVITESRCLEITPSFRSSGDKQMISAVGSDFSNFKIGGLLALR